MELWMAAAGGERSWEAGAGCVGARGAAGGWAAEEAAAVAAAEAAVAAAEAAPEAGLWTLSLWESLSDAGLVLTPSEWPCAADCSGLLRFRVGFTRYWSGMGPVWNGKEKKTSFLKKRFNRSNALCFNPDT